MKKFSFENFSFRKTFDSSLMRIKEEFEFQPLDYLVGMSNVGVIYVHEKNNIKVKFFDWL